MKNLHKVKEPIEITPEVLENSGFIFEGVSWVYENDGDKITITFEDGYKELVISTPWSVIKYQTSDWISIYADDIEKMLDICGGNDIKINK